MGPLALASSGTRTLVGLAARSIQGLRLRSVGAAARLPRLLRRAGVCSRTQLWPFLSLVGQESSAHFPSRARHFDEQAVNPG